MSIQDIRLLLTDVDGVLTNGKIYLTGAQEWVQFDIQDGIGHRLALCGGLPVGWLSGRFSKAVAYRARHLKVPYLLQGKLDKVAAAKKLCDQLRLSLSQVAYIGDDIIDSRLLHAVGFSVSVPYGRPEVRKRVDYVTRSQGGDGAFREVVEKILKSQGKWDQAVEKFHQINEKHSRTNQDVFI